MGRIFRLFFVLIGLGILALIGYAYSGYMQPSTHQVTQPVTLDVD